MVVRNSKTLPWKLGDADYDVLVIERGGELVGLSASRRKGEQWLICDVLARDLGDSLRATLAATVNLANVRAPAFNLAGKPVPKVTVLATPSIDRLCANWDLFVMLTTFRSWFIFSTLL